MASLNDIETQIQNIIDIIEGRVISTITGVLPLTFTAKGGTAVDWVIEGNDDNGTENLFDNQLEQGTIIASGEEPATNRVRYDTSVTVDTYKTYSQSATAVDTSKTLEFIAFGYNGSAWVSLFSGWKPLNTIFDTSYCDLVRIVYRFSDNTDITPADVTNVMLVKGSTAPDYYIPYQQGVGEQRVDGYYVPLTISQQGQPDKTVDIYIGDSPLTEGETVSKTSTGQDIELFGGENTVSTTLYNKPTMEIKYKSRR